MTKSELLLRWMKDDPKGKTLCEIQTFLLNTDPKTYQHLDLKTGKRKISKRGWWCTNLYEDSIYDTGKVGMLIQFCQKINGRWHVTEPIKPPFSVMHKKTKSYHANNKRKNAEHSARIAKLPKCDYCYRPYHSTDGSMRTFDGACITTSSASGYVIDCMGRVFYTVEYRHTDLKMENLTTLQPRDMHALHDMFNSEKDYDTGRKLRQDWVKSHILKVN